MDVIQGSITDLSHPDEINQLATQLLSGEVISIKNNNDALLLTIETIQELVDNDKINVEEYDTVDRIRESAANILNNVLGDNPESKHKIKHMSLNSQDDMITLTYTLDTSETYPEEQVYPEDITTPTGVFAYVHNFTVDYFSEYGYVFFMKDPVTGTVGRIG